MIIIDVSNNLEPVYLRKYKSGEVRSYSRLFSMATSTKMDSFQNLHIFIVRAHICSSNILLYYYILIL